MILRKLNKDTIKHFLGKSLTLVHNETCLMKTPKKFPSSAKRHTKTRGLNISYVILLRLHGDELMLCKLAFTYPFNVN